MTKYHLIAVSLLAAVVLVFTVDAQEVPIPLDPRYADAKYCGVENIQRDAQGEIIRDKGLKLRYQSIWGCPSTLLKKGSCPGYQLQHVLPLACGGCDAIHNVVFMATILKTGPGTLPLDRHERKMFCFPQVAVPMPISTKEFPLRLMVVPAAP